MTGRPDESDLVAMWREVLRDPAADEDTSFFDAGGSSLTAVRLKAALDREWQLDVDLGTIVDNATPAELAVALEEATQPS